MRLPIMSLRSLMALSLVLSLSACSTMDTVKGWFDVDDGEDLTAPVELVEINESVKIKKLWSKGVGDGQGKGYLKIQPVISGDSIYVASADGEVVSIERNTGKVQWSVDLDVSISGGVGVYENALLLGGNDGSVMQLNASDGSLNWTTRVNGEVLAPPQGNGRVVVAQSYEGRVQGLDFNTGEKLWVFNSNVPVLTVRGTSTPILSNNMVYVGFASGRVLSLESTTGAVAWEARVAIPQGRSEIERIVDVDGTMLLAGKELYAASYQGRLVAIDVGSGRKLWQQDVSSFAGVSQGFGNVYVTDENGTVLAYLRNGQGERWSQTALGYRELSRPTPVSSYLAVADFEGYVHLMSQVDGKFVGRMRVDGNGSRADMLSDGNILYVYGNSGKLIAYKITAKE
jgi:outer membrane protein assembly factor BamB